MMVSAMPLKQSRHVLFHFWTASASSPTQLLAILLILKFLHVFYLNGMSFKPQSVCGAALVGGYISNFSLRVFSVFMASLEPLRNSQRDFSSSVTLKDIMLQSRGPGADTRGVNEVMLRRIAVIKSSVVFNL